MEKQALSVAAADDDGTCVPLPLFPTWRQFVTDHVSPYSKFSVYFSILYISILKGKGHLDFISHRFIYSYFEKK